MRLTHFSLLPRSSRPALTVALLAATTVLALGAQSAHAGTYTVSGSCGWQPWTETPSVQVYATSDPAVSSCPALSIAAPNGAPAGTGGGWTLNAPTGTSIVSASFVAYASAANWWQAAVFRAGGANSGSSWLNCPAGDGCFANPGNQFLSGPGYNATSAIAHVRCRAPLACSGQAALQIAGTITTQLQDDTAPNVSVSGAATTGSWLNGTPAIDIDAVDNTGIQRIRFLVDGRTIGGQDHPCDYRFPVPCANQRSSFSVPTGTLGEGEHVLSAEAVDASGNAAGPSRPLRIDTTPPATPQDVQIEGGTSWSSTDTRRVTWTNPPHRFAPIVAARYTLCPTEADSTDPQVAAQAAKRCVSREATGKQISEIPELALPAPGLWTLKLWLVDSAGNADRGAAATIKEIGYDPTPPSIDGFLPQDPNDPARATVRASDDHAPITSASIEIRRDTRATWRPLPTTINGGAVSAFVDDQRLRRGRYLLRAIVANAAGLQHGTDRGLYGEVKLLELPVRMSSRLHAGKPNAQNCRHAKRKRTCRTKLDSTLELPLNRRATIRGRLQSGRQGIAGQPVEIWQRIALPAAPWTPVATATTDTRGGFRHHAAAGPARELQFRYPGTTHVRGTLASVKLRVRAKTSFAVSRKHVINGEYVTFKGTLAGGWRPASGLLVELQVRSRGKWRTFAQPRADATTGRWRYQYRFETVSGNARFAFRARIRRQSGFPYAPGTSRPVAVTVSGL